MPLETHHSENDYQITIQEFPGIFFTEISGGEEGNDTTLSHSGGPGQGVQVISGPSKVGQITLGKPRDLVVDAQLDAWSAAYSRGLQVPLTVVKQPVDPSGIPIGRPTVYRGCMRVSYQTPDATKGGSAAAKLRVVLQPKSAM